MRKSRDAVTRREPRSSEFGGAPASEALRSSEGLGLRAAKFRCFGGTPTLETGCYSNTLCCKSPHLLPCNNLLNL